MLCIFGGRADERSKWEIEGWDCGDVKVGTSVLPNPPFPLGVGVNSEAKINMLSEEMPCKIS
eukprot:6103577-Ditylum_brightwellii.AAC.1